MRGQKLLSPKKITAGEILVKPSEREGVTAGGRGGHRRRAASRQRRRGCQDSGGAGEPAGLTTMSTAMDRHIEVVKQYTGQQQVDLAVEIEVPGSWFGVGPMGALTPTERREKYTAQAVEYSEVREFPGASRTARKTKEKAICFICCADAAHEPNSEGYCMKLSQWNCYRNNTFKDRREDELPFIPGQAPAAEGGVAVNLKAPQTPSIKTVFTLTSEGVHSQRDGNRVQSGGPACRRAASWTAALSKIGARAPASFSDTSGRVTTS